MKITSGSTNICLTNMSNFHTCSVGHVHLVMAVVSLPHGELVELSGDVICGACVNVPIGVDAVGGVGHGAHTLLLGECDVEAPVALYGGVVRLLADLAEHLRELISSAASLATPTVTVPAAAVASIATATTVTTAASVPATASSAREATATTTGGDVRG